MDDFIYNQPPKRQKTYDSRCDKKSPVQNPGKKKFRDIQKILSTNRTNDPKFDPLTSATPSRPPYLRSLEGREWQKKREKWLESKSSVISPVASDHSPTPEPLLDIDFDQLA